MFLIFLMQALFALTFPLAKLGLAYTGPLILIGVRMSIAGLLFLIYEALRARTLSISRQDLFLFAKTSLFYIYLSFVPEVWALGYMSSLKNNMLWSSLPFISALLSYFLVAERLSKKQWLGLCVGLAGMVPILAVPDQLIACSELLCISWPELIMFVAVTSTAYAWFLVKELMDRGYSLVIINGYTMLFGGLLAFATRFMMFGTAELYSNGTMMLFYATVLALLGNIIAYMIYGHLTRAYSLTFLSLSGFLCPLFGILFGWLFFSEQLYLQYIVGLALIGTGLWLFYSQSIYSKESHGV